MKILHISTIIEWRGGDNQLLTTIKILKKSEGIKHEVLCAKGSVLSEKCEAEKIPFYTASRKSKFSFPFLKKIIEVVKKNRIDVIHVHDSNALSLTSIAIKFLPDVKLIYSRKRNNRVKNSFLKRIKYNNIRINGIICVSNAVKEVLIPVLNEPEKIQVIYDGIDVENISKSVTSNILRKEYNISPNTKIVGNISGLSKQKDLFTFLDAAKIIKDNFNGNIKFFVVGEGPLEKDIKTYAVDLHLSENVIFTGFRNDIHKVLPEFDLFLISSQTEGLPLSILEAFSCRVPVVATAAGGTGEAVKHRKTGMLSPIQDATHLADNALELFQNPTLATVIRNNAFQLVSEEFTLRKMEENYYNYYKSLIS